MKCEEGQQQQGQQQQPYIPLAKNFGPFYILAGAYPAQDFGAGQLINGWREYKILRIIQKNEQKSKAVLQNS